MSLKAYIILSCILPILICCSCTLLPLSIESGKTSQENNSEGQRFVITNESVKSENQTSENRENGLSSKDPTFDACTLITKAEIEAIQGEAVKETKNTSRLIGALVVSQCFYQLTTYSKSISLEITRSNPNNPDKYNLRAFWKEKFNVQRPVDNDRDREGQDDKQNIEKKGDGKQTSSQLQVIPKLGDEAFRTGNRITDALYILKKNTIIRISIGGTEEEAKKIKKLKMLARNVLKRL